MVLAYLAASLAKQGGQGLRQREVGLAKSFANLFRNWVRPNFDRNSWVIFRFPEQPAPEEEDLTKEGE